MAKAVAKKPVVTPELYAQAKMTAIALGTDELSELMKLLEQKSEEQLWAAAQEKAAKEKHQKQLWGKSYSKNFLKIRQLFSSYCSYSQITYNEAILLKSSVNAIAAAVNEVVYSTDGVTKPMYQHMKLAAKDVKEAYDTGDSKYPASGVPLMPVFESVLTHIVLLAMDSPGAKADTDILDKLSEVSFIPKEIVTTYNEAKEKSKASKAKNDAQYQASVEKTKKAEYKHSMPVEQTGSDDKAAKPATQKRAGIVSLDSLESGHRSILNGAVQVAQILGVMSPVRGSYEDNVAWLQKIGIEPNSFNRYFFRPCPKFPCHGFVDSVVCESWDEVKTLYETTLAADPEAEVIIMSELDAKSNAIVTSKMVAIGPGNDGATAGKETTVYDLTSADIASPTRSSARLKAGDEGYIEAVYDGRWSYLVQLRGGPVPPSSAKRIAPAPIEAIREVIFAEGLGLEWEKRMAAFKGKPEAGTTVVWHPKGSVLSHFAVHAMLNGVAVSFEDESPQVGESFEGEIPDLNWDKHSFAKGAAMAILDAKAGRLSDPNELMLALMFAATGVHSATSLLRGDSAELLGGACATLMLLASAACCGESRHNQKVRSLAKIDTERHQVFVRALSDYMGARPLLRLSLESFAADTWSSAYGGARWAKCAAMVIDLENAMFEVVRGQGEVSHVVKLAHRLLNAVHNGGKLLNKFGNTAILDIACQGSRTFATHSAFRWYAIAHGERKNPSTKVTEMMMRIKAAGGFGPGAFNHWNSDSGDFEFSKKVTTRVLTDGVAQVRVVNADEAEVKVQYCFASAVVGEEDVDAEAAEKYKNVYVDKSDGSANPSGHTSITTKNQSLIDLMVKYAQEVGGLDQVGSMANSKVAYVKATKVEPLGKHPVDGVKIYFGDEWVEVKA